jgi:hypothetical protein
MPEILSCYYFANAAFSSGYASLMPGRLPDDGSKTIAAKRNEGASLFYSSHATDATSGKAPHHSRVQLALIARASIAPLEVSDAR